MSTITPLRGPPVSQSSPQHLQSSIIAQPSSTWRRTFLRSLHHRDTTEHSLNALILPYTALASRLSATSPHKLNSLEKEIIRIQRRCRDLEEEVREKDRIVQMVQDEILVLQLERNVAVQREEEVREENRRLVERWVQEKGKMAEEMNRQLG